MNHSTMPRSAGIARAQQLQNKPLLKSYVPKPGCIVSRGVPSAVGLALPGGFAGDAVPRLA